MLFHSFVELKTLFQYHAILLVSNELSWHEFPVERFCQCLEKLCQISINPNKISPFSDDFNHPDILIIDRKRSKLRLEDIQEVKNFCLYPPQLGARRLVFIENCERLNINSANSLLKLLEEPHEQVVFLLTTAHKNLILQTILSRLQIFYVNFEENAAQSFIDQFDTKTQKFFEDTIYAFNAIKPNNLKQTDNKASSYVYYGKSLSDPKSFHVGAKKLSELLITCEQLGKQYTADQLRDLIVYWMSDRLKKDKTFVMIARFIMAQLRDWKRVEQLNPSSQFWLVRIFLGQHI